MSQVFVLFIVVVPHGVNACQKGKKVKLSLCLTKHYAMKTYGEVDA
jgi:hypothetical protein